MYLEGKCNIFGSWKRSLNSNAKEVNVCVSENIGNLEEGKCEKAVENKEKSENLVQIPDPASSGKSTTKFHASRVPGSAKPISK